MECRELTELAMGRIVGDASPAERDALAEHVGKCARCAADLVALEATWEDLGADPGARVTPEFRAATLELLEDEMVRGRVRGFRASPRASFPLWQAAAALVVAASAGFLAARGGLGTREPAAAAARAPASPAAAAASWPDLGGAPRLSNVAYRSDEPGKVGIEFDATTRHSIVGTPDDPRVSSLIAYLLSNNAETAGEKSRAIELVSENFGPGAAPASPEIVSALSTTLKRDRNPGVRKKAAEALASFRSTREIRTALLDSLANDPNPGVRLVAVDALAAAAKESPDPRTIRSLREKAFDPQENGFVRARAASALKAIDL
ncbi:MAG TPA: HEAT repeat domain-containing protein [Thermoanaerobaculia bacterium]|nr:HEAT repeat domain-containing protein [Thermoanaerobaculia bacterium]